MNDSSTVGAMTAKQDAAARLPSALSGDHVMTDARTVTAQLQSFKNFRLSLKGSVVLPDDAKYDELRTPWLEVIEQCGS